MHNYPFSFVEHESTRALFAYLNPDIIPITRNTCKNDILTIHRREKEKVRDLLERAPSRICLTLDVWTSITTERYISLTAHFIDDKWKLHSKILNFCQMPPPHSDIALSEKVLQFLMEWGIEKKIFSLTLDNCSANDNMQDFLKRQLKLQNHLLCSGDYFHIRCCVHILNLIVQEGLKVFGDSLHNIRESVKYVKWSESRMRKFEDCAEQVGVVTSMGLHMDVPTRWNSTFFMLESALIYQHVFTHLELVDDGYKYCPSTNEWKRGERICKFLKPFFEITNLISGSEYVTANLYFGCVWKIQLRLLEEIENPDPVISRMAYSMKLKFEKYWDCYSVVLAFAIVLDPRFKLKFVDFCYKKLDESTFKERVTRVRREMYLLFQEYASKFPYHPTSNQSSIGTSNSGGKTSMVEDDIDEFDFYESDQFSSTKKSELDLYLEESGFDRKQYPDINVLNYWKGSERRYPILSLMACDIISILITNVASESVFSIGSRVPNKYRSSILLENVELVTTTRNWLHGYVAEDDMDFNQLNVVFSKMKVSELTEASNTLVE